jgi:hypothetical protein
MRLFRTVTIVLVVGVLVGVAVLIVVEVAGYDGRADREEGRDPGTKGETVRPGPASALIRSSTRSVEGVIRDRRDLTRLTAALNALAPAAPVEEEGEYTCPESEPFYDLIELRYDGAPETKIAIEPDSCGGTAVLNLKEDKEFGASKQLLRLLDRLLEEKP